jgi:hypothetical protein
MQDDAVLPDEAVFQRRGGRAGSVDEEKAALPTRPDAAAPSDDDLDNDDLSTIASSFNVAMSLAAAEIASEAGIGVADFIILVLTRSEPSTQLSALVFVTIFEELTILVMASVASGIAIALIEAVTVGSASRAATARLSIAASAILSMAVCSVLVAVVQPSLVTSLNLEGDAVALVQNSVLPVCLALIPATLVRTADVLLGAMDAYTGLAMTGIVEAVVDVTVFALLQPHMGVAAYPWGKLAGVCSGLVCATYWLYRTSENAASEPEASASDSALSVAEAGEARGHAQGLSDGAAAADVPSGSPPALADGAAASAAGPDDGGEEEEALMPMPSPAPLAAHGDASEKPPTFVDLWLPCSAADWSGAVTMFLELGLPSAAYVVVELMGHYFIALVAGSVGTSDVVALRIVEGPLWPVLVFTMAVLESVAARASVLVAEGRASVGHELMVVARNLAWLGTGSLFLLACVLPASVLAYPFYDECPQQDCKHAVELARVITIISSVSAGLLVLEWPKDLWLVVAGTSCPDSTPATSTSNRSAPANATGGALAGSAPTLLEPRGTRSTGARGTARPPPRRPPRSS